MRMRDMYRTLRPYLLSVPAWFIAFGIRSILPQRLESQGDFLVSAASVVAVANTVGLGPGMLTAALCAVFWKDPRATSFAGMTQHLSFGFVQCALIAAVASATTGLRRRFIEPTSQPAHDRVRFHEIGGNSPFVASRPCSEIDFPRSAKNCVCFNGDNNELARRNSIDDLKAQLAAIVESSDDAIIGKNFDGTITSWNRGAERIFGYSAEEVIGRSVTLLMPTDRVHEESTILGRLRQGERIDHFESVRVTKDGHTVNVSLTISPIRTPTGDLVGVSKIARDISERVRANEAFDRESELRQRLGLIAESVPGVICSFRLTPDGRPTMPIATPAIEDLYGFPRSKLADDFSPVRANVHPDYLEEFDESVRVAFSGPSSWHCKFRYCHPTKGVRWIEGWSRPVLEEDGSVLWHGFLMDVTSFEEAQENRREAERVGRSVLDSIPSHVALLDDTGTIVSVNHAWRQFASMNGAGSGVSEGANYLQVCDAVADESQETAASFASGIRDILEGSRDSFALEYDCHSSTERRWFIGRATPLRGGAARGVVVSHQDVTLLKRTQEQIVDRDWVLSKSQMMAQVGSWEVDVSELADAGQSKLRCSSECIRIFGWEPSPGESTYALFLETVHAQDRVTVARALEDCVSLKHRREIEHRIVRRDGTERIVYQWFEVVARPGQRSLRLIGTCQDVTENRRMQIALSENEERLELAIASADLGTWDANLLEGMVKWSQRVEELFGYMPGEFDGTIESVRTRVHPDDLDDFDRAIALARVTQSQYRHQYRIILTDGSIRWIEGCGRFTYDEAGEAVRVSGVAQDITDRKFAEFAAREYSTRLAHLREIDTAIISAHSTREIVQAAIEHLSMLVPCWTGGVIRVDLDRKCAIPIASVGILDQWFPAGVEFTTEGYDPKRVQSVKEGKIEFVEDIALLPETTPLIRALYAHGLRSYVRVPLLDRGVLVGMLLIGSENACVYTADHLEIIREVTEQLAVAIHQSLLFEEIAEAKLRLEDLARRLLKAGEDERSRIARELHDEVGQCLVCAKMSLDRLARDNPGEKRIVEAVEFVVLALEQVRDLSRLLRPMVLDALGLADALRSLVEDKAKRAGLGAKFCLDPESGRVSPEIETACFRIVQEALNNTLKHAQASQIEVSLKRDGDTVEVQVSDDGKGFDVPTAMSRSARGASLGMLSICERAELAGGKATIISWLNQGTTVRVVFQNASKLCDRHV